jgi:hypothetical protein
MDTKDDIPTEITEHIPETVKDKAQALQAKAEGNSLYGESKFEEVG